ncbi:hypothetical protein HHI36_015062 [Cryptolaemus montrouzieri]|uniref:Uncharacterized protein n=1 Tax=Cryptolaemus montrouzieri TaxID=559131 RepID=A0ABD2N4L6_9CUCU
MDLDSWFVKKMRQEVPGSGKYGWGRRRPDGSKRGPRLSRNSDSGTRITESDFSLCSFDYVYGCPQIVFFFRWVWIRVSGVLCDQCNCREKAWTTQELSAILQENDCDKVDAVYIPPEMDELTDEENIGDDLIGEFASEFGNAVVGTFEIHSHPGQCVTQISMSSATDDIIAKRPHSPSPSTLAGASKRKRSSCHRRESTISTKQSVPKSKTNAGDTTKFGRKKSATRGNRVAFEGVLKLNRS